MRVLFLTICLISMAFSGPHAQQAKAIFLVPYSGTGTVADPFLPKGADASTGCIDRRPNPSVVTGWAICGRPTLPATAGIVSIAASAGSTLTPAQKSVLGTDILGADILTSTDLPSALAELLIDKAAKKDKIKAGSDGKYKIYLGGQEAVFQQTAWLYDELHILDGGLVADVTNFASDLAEPAIAWAASASETFDVADNATLSGILTWSEDVGTGWNTCSNQACNTTVGSVQMAHATTGVSTDAHNVSATRVGHAGTGSGTFRSGVIGRKANDTTQTMYFFGGNQSSSGANQHELYKMVTGTQTSLGTDPLDVANGVILKLVMDGSNISGYIDGSLLIGPITDTSITGNLYGGIYANSNVSSITCTYDNWVISDNVTGRQRGMLIF